MATVKEVLKDRDKRAFEEKPGSLLWILAGITRAKIKGSRIEERVPGQPGLYLLSQATGGQSWTYRYRRPVDSRAAKLTLGKVDINRELEPGEEPDFGEGLTKDMAAALASWCRVQVKAGRDPAAVRQQREREMEALKRETWDGWTVDNLFVEFMQTYPPVRAGRSATESTKRQTGFLLGLRPDGKGSWEPTGNGVLGKWQGKTFSSRDGTPKLTRKAAFDVLKEMKDVMANRTLAALKLFGRWAVEHEYITANPYAEMRKLHGEEPRDRVLKADEIRALWQVVETAKEGEAISYPYGRMAQLILVTGQRPGEISGAAWSEFDFAEREWTIPKRRTKNRKSDHVVPLTPLALRVLATLPKRGEYLFTAIGSNSRPIRKETAKHRFAKPMAEKLGRVVEPPWTYHDLRRTAYSGIAEDFTYVVADMVTNHAPPKMAQTYGSGANLSRFKWEALDAWAKRLEVIIAEPTQAAACTQQRAHV